jgi:hypothetical protein
MFWRLFVPVVCIVLGISVAFGCLTVRPPASQEDQHECVSKNELTRIPGWKYAYQKQEQCNFPNPGEVSVALQIFYVSWYETFGDRADAVYENLNNIIVEWREDLMPFERGYSVDGTFIESGVATGLTRSKDYIIVRRAFATKIYDTSFVHELVHASIRAANPGQHGDPDHEGPKYKGWEKEHTTFIKHVNETLRLMDLNYAEENKKDYFFQR